MDPVLILILVFFAVAGLAVGIFERKTKPRRSKRTRSVEVHFESNDEQGLLPFRSRTNLLSQAELQFYHRLVEAVGNRATVCPKVRMVDIFDVDMGQTMQPQAYRNRIDKKHVDFMLCEPGSMRLLVGVELDDRSHQRADRQERDALVDEIFETARLPLLHFPVRSNYAPEDLEAQLGRYLGSTPQRLQPAANSSVVNSETTRKPEPPCCPKCDREMILRTVKSGEYAGKRFWGCTTYPACRGMLPYKTPVT